MLSCTLSCGLIVAPARDIHSHLCTWLLLEHGTEYTFSRAHILFLLIYSALSPCSLFSHLISTAYSPLVHQKYVYTLPILRSTTLLHCRDKLLFCHSILRSENHQKSHSKLSQFWRHSTSNITDSILNQHIKCYLIETNYAIRKSGISFYSHKRICVLNMSIFG